MSTQIQTLVDNFVQQLHAVWRQSALEAIGGVGTKNGKTPKLSFASGRAKGEKRAPEEIEALKEKFVAFISKNPGLRIEQINKELGTTTKELSLPIRQLLGDGVVKATGEKRSTTYKAR